MGVNLRRFHAMRGGGVAGQSCTHKASLSHLLAQVDATTAAKEEKFSEAIELLRKLLLRLQSENQASAQRDMEIQRLQGEGQQKDTEIQNLQDEGQQKDAAAQRLQEEVRGGAAENQRLQGEGQQKDTEIQRLQGEGQQKDTALQKMGFKEAAAQALAASRNGEVDTVRQQLSQAQQQFGQKSAMLDAGEVAAEQLRRKIEEQNQGQVRLSARPLCFILRTVLSLSLSLFLLVGRNTAALAPNYAQCVFNSVRFLSFLVFYVVYLPYI